MSQKILSVIVLIFISHAPVFAQAEAGTDPKDGLTQEVQKKVFRKIRALASEGDQLISLYDKLSDAPKSTTIWQPLTADKSEIESRINRLAGNVEDILLPASFKSFTRDYRDKKDRITKLRSEINELKIKRLAAPESREYYLDPVTVSQKAIDGYIKNKSDKIDSLHNDLKSLVSSYSENIYSKYGIRLMPEQLEALLSRVDGADITRATVVMGAASEVLQGLAVQLNIIEKAEAAEKYYAIIVLVREAMVFLWSEHFAKYDEEWLPKVDDLQKELESLISKNRTALSNEVSDERSAVLRNNVSANKFSLNVLTEYKSSLLDQREKVKNILKEAKADLRVAKLTLDTAGASSDLVGVIKQSRNEFQALMEVQIPDVRKFENNELRNEYNRITNEINR